MKAGSRRTKALLVISLACLPVAHAGQVDIAGPAGSVAFGTFVATLPNGNIAVTDPQATVSGVVRAGAVYLYSRTGELISTLVGSSTDDRVGSQGVLVVGEGNLVALSPNWNSPSAPRAGAATWIDGTTGLDGPVDASNSLIGASGNDFVASRGAIALTNGNYVVLSPLWDGVGAATWASGVEPTSATVSTANSLHGTTNGDSVGTEATPLVNGNYVVSSPVWSNGVVNAGFGAATWADGSQPTGAPVTATNSLHGTTTGDRVGVQGVYGLSNGNYVVMSNYWNNGTPEMRVGAATWGNGAGGTVGAVSTGNSLHGSAADDQVGIGRIIALEDGNYVVLSRIWSSSKGAATWSDGATGMTVGAVSTGNSLTGSSAGDGVGQLGFTLRNGAYVVSSEAWNAGTGAATWCPAGGCSGPVSTGNSFTGSATGQLVRAYPLSDGNYVVANSAWSSATTSQVGAVTWGDGEQGLLGEASESNSLVGTAAGDRIGSNGVVGTLGGSYVVSSASWHGEGGVTGATTWIRGHQPFAGAVTSHNSLVGARGLLRMLADGNYVVSSMNYDGGPADAGAMTLGSGRYRLTGRIAAWNSVMGAVEGGGSTMVYAYAPTRQQLIVGRPAENRVSLFTMDQLFAEGLEP